MALFLMVLLSSTVREAACKGMASKIYKFEKAAMKGRKQGCEGAKEMGNRRGTTGKFKGATALP